MEKEDEPVLGLAAAWMVDASWAAEVPPKLGTEKDEKLGKEKEEKSANRIRFTPSAAWIAWWV